MRHAPTSDWGGGGRRGRCRIAALVDQLWRTTFWSIAPKIERPPASSISMRTRSPQAQERRRRLPVEQGLDGSLLGNA
jgi:hypothetical protein